MPWVGQASGLDDPGDGLGGFGDHVACLVLVAGGGCVGDAVADAFVEQADRDVLQCAVDCGAGRVRVIGPGHGSSAGIPPRDDGPLGASFRPTRDHPLRKSPPFALPCASHNPPDPAAAGRGKGRPQADPEGTRSALPATESAGTLIGWDARRRYRGRTGRGSRIPFCSRHAAPGRGAGSPHQRLPGLAHGRNSRSPLPEENWRTPWTLRCSWAQPESRPISGVHSGDGPPTSFAPSFTDRRVRYTVTRDER